MQLRILLWAPGYLCRLMHPVPSQFSRRDEAMLDPHVISRLTMIAGKDNVYTAPEDLICYSYDSTPLSHLPDVVIAPETAEKIAAIVKLANQYKIPIVPRGGGTNLSGGSVPLQGGIVLSLHKMDKILEIDEENLTATVQAGVITAALHQAAEKIGLFYPPDPQSMFMSTIGGNVAENAGGPHCLKYGVTRDYILGMEVVTPTGDVLRLGGKVIKYVSGYDLMRLFTGSEGTLGIITEVTLKLLPLPETKKTILAVFEKLDNAAQAVSAIIKNRIIPTTLELMDHNAMELIEACTPAGFPMDVEGVLLIEIDGSQHEVDTQMEKVADLCTKVGARDVRVAKNALEAEQLWAGRRNAFGAMAKSARMVLAEDATVPRSKVPDIVRRIQTIAEKYRLRIPILGHTGDGNMHPQILMNPDDADEMERVDLAIDEIFAAAIEFGGTLSGEHGIGVLKQKYMEWEFGKAGIAFMQAIKKAVDPNNILNPGKIV